MKPISLHQPRRISFGEGCSRKGAAYLLDQDLKRILLITSPPILPLVDPIREILLKGAAVEILDCIEGEPTIRDFEDVREVARVFDPDSVLGVGGGSVLDVAKLVAVLHSHPDLQVEEQFGIGRLPRRNLYLACFPTTAGTGSEVSPNSILLDESDHLKKGVVSPYLVPDAAFVDPLLTHTVPPPVTAATGMDALVHCIEAYTNKHAHPLVDGYALQGIELIGRSLKEAVRSSDSACARSDIAMGSLLGGLCLGPVNTAAVHALAYPLGGEFHVPHGVSNSILLPAVFEFNLPASPERHARVAEALGAPGAGSEEETARRGLQAIRQLSRDIGIPEHLSSLGIPREALPRLAEAAMKVTRLLVNNPRELVYDDALAIYEAVY